MEGFLRDLPSFRKFLPLAASASGEILSWNNFAQDVGVDAKTIRSYFEILETLTDLWEDDLKRRFEDHKI